jgi:hypothetical protein
MGIILENEAEYFGMKDRIAELAGENMRLEAENAAWIREHQNLVHLYQNQLAENAELQKDAARYRYYRATMELPFDLEFDGTPEGYAEALDAAIDAAILGEQS